MKTFSRCERTGRFGLEFTLFLLYRKIEKLTESFDKTVPVKPRPLRRFPSSEDDVKALNPHRQRLVRLDLHGARTPFSCAADKTQEKRSGMTDIQSGLNKLHGATLNVCNSTH